tara:strand:- start:388 stop:1131 length:744 start_codon:yes stop_codon:yes gene_type:complete
MENNVENNTSFEKVKLDIFEGPLDLLLNLIKENDLDIYELSLTQVTQQYLEYVELLKRFDFDNIGDYMVIAAELGRLKSRSLLPKDEEEEVVEGDTEIDLVEMLREYKKYRNLSEELNNRPILGRDTFKKSFDSTYRTETVWEVQKTDVWKLVGALKNLLALERYKDPPEIEFKEEIINKFERRKEIQIQFNNQERIKFKDFFLNLSKENIIVSFLILLELVRESLIDFSGTNENDIEFFIKGETNE